MAPFDPEVKGGDYSFREIPADTACSTLCDTHPSTHFDHSGLATDLNVAFPLDRIRELAELGRIGRAVTNGYYRHVVETSVATATNDLAALQAEGLLAARGEGRARTYSGTFRLIAMVASAANAPVLASGDASLTEQREVVMSDLRERVTANRR